MSRDHTLRSLARRADSGDLAWSLGPSPPPPAPHVDPDPETTGA